MNESILSVEGLFKYYPGFTLRDVSFALEAGTITGFIGRNGAGKTTTLSCLLNLVHPDAGTIRFFGRPFDDAELEIKGELGFISGGVSYYPHKKLHVITEVTRKFYPNWDGDGYRRLMEEFHLPDTKTPAELSEGMKVKYALALALSHHARLLLLDEPTSGLDPVSREELLEVFLRLARREGTTILFSTHITGDLEKCAERILYLREGVLAEDCGLDTLLEKYRVVAVAQRDPALIGPREERLGWTGLVKAGAPLPLGAEVRQTTLEEIMIHLESEGVRG